ncbi:sugar ABC transporter ATP-binding protein [Ectobacillus ponti]|uniref:Sugar ABC transporter ATP-binding protein n=1 Tax=Ectobacillus ponti TaxID=2961894 RepID=A0AA42BTN7_9BACI|nr:sugar ABC transporter ATP-binding protein [Ectobacillus ponti]MCP8969673.1 sugar ABC transporter ATP-binding protein [Ectobacillus ponti]
MGTEQLLQMTGIVKTFPGVKALKSVELNIRKGEVHALMGENGAGKSTLIKILTGVYHHDEGTIVLDGENVHFKAPIEAQHKGISTIYQEVSLIPYLSVTENIFIGREPVTRFGTIDWKKAHEAAEQVLFDMGISIDVKQPVHTYSTAIQQMVSIARAVSMKAKLVVMDEPTSSLDDKEVEVLFEVINKLKRDGVAIIFVSHRLDEIYTVCDRITVLRDGSYVGTWPIQELSQNQLIAYMIGKSEKEAAELTKMKETVDKSGGKVMVQLKGVKQGNRVADVSFELYEGEVLGLAGLLGSGRTETAKTIAGVTQPDEGTISYRSQPVRFASPSEAIAAGIAICTENRKAEGIIPNMSVRENITLASLKQFSRFGFVSRQKQDKVVNEFVKRMGIKTPNVDQKIKNLSGGNQQKVLLARWLAMNPSVLILDEPTRGIDVGAKSEIHTLISELSQQGLSILLISSEFDELIHNSDRVLVLREGEKIGELTGNQRTQDNIMRVIAEHSSHSELRGGESHARG